MVCSEATVALLPPPGQGSRLHHSSEAQAVLTELIRPATVNRVPAHRRLTTELLLRQGLIRSLPLKTELLSINRPLHQAAAVHPIVARAVQAAAAALTVAPAAPAAALTVVRAPAPAAVQ